MGLLSLRCSLKYFASLKTMSMPILTKNMRPLSRCHLYCIFVVRITSRRCCVYLWCERLWPGTYAETGWPYTRLSATWKARLRGLEPNSGVWMALCVATAPKKDRWQRNSHSGIQAAQASRGCGCPTAADRDCAHRGQLSHSAPNSAKYPPVNISVRRSSWYLRPSARLNE